MEKETICIIITFLIFISALIYAGYLIRHVHRVHDSRTFIYPKTGNKYYVCEVVESKHPDTGEWYEVVLYSSIKTGNKYVREKQDFINEFIPIIEWRKKQGNQTM